MRPLREAAEGYHRVPAGPPPEGRRAATAIDAAEGLPYRPRTT
jgi:hypothetical protein